jgi:hypothetical protein
MPLLKTLCARETKLVAPSWGGHFVFAKAAVAFACFFTQKRFFWGVFTGIACKYDCFLAMIMLF